MFVLAASDARSAYKELRAKMQLRLASHLIDGFVEDKNVMLMPALSPPARAGFAETRADIATGKCAPVHCTFWSTLVFMVWCRCCWCTAQEHVH